MVHNEALSHVYLSMQWTSKTEPRDYLSLTFSPIKAVETKSLI